MPRIDRPHPDAGILSGFPADGDPIPLNVGDPPAPTPAPNNPPEDPAAREMRELRERLDRQEQELTHLRRTTPPPTPPAPTPAPVAADETDWDNEFFTSPSKALAKREDALAKKIAQELRGEYQRDRSTQVFWEKFYDAHPDLKQDHDLVDTTLKSNLAEMSSMPVERAMERLADLTRERILRYAGGAGKARAPKARAEGATPAAPAAPAVPAAPAGDKIMSITDIIKERKEKRRAAAGA